MTGVNPALVADEIYCFFYHRLGFRRRVFQFDLLDVRRDRVGQVGNRELFPKVRALEYNAGAFSAGKRKVFVRIKRDFVGEDHAGSSWMAATAFSARFLAVR